MLACMPLAAAGAFTWPALHTRGLRRGGREAAQSGASSGAHGARTRGWRRAAALGGSSLPLGDPHRVLGVEPGADQATIKKAFRRLALRLHPDVSHAEGAQERFQVVQHAYDALVERHLAAAEAAAAGPLGSRRRRAAPDEQAPAAVPEAPRTAEEQQDRWKSQLGGLAARAVAQRERRESEKRYRAAMREHAVRGSFSGSHSTAAGRERLSEQLSDLYYTASTAGGGALGRPAPIEAHMLSAHASGLAHAAQAADDASAAPPPPPPPLSATEKEVMQQLMRLARVAQTWRLASGHDFEPAGGEQMSEESLTPGE